MIIDNKKQITDIATGVVVIELALNLVSFKMQQRVDAIKKLGMETSCEKGCSACCSIPVATTMPEAMLIAKRYPDVVREVLPEAKRHTEALKSGDIHAFDEPCVFLDKTTGSCRVYEARPMECRQLYALASPKWCDVNSEYGTVNIGASDVEKTFQEIVVITMTPIGGSRFGALPWLLEDALRAVETNSYDTSRDIEHTADFTKRIEASELRSKPSKPKPPPPDFDIAKFSKLLPIHNYTG